MAGSGTRRLSLRTLIFCCVGIIALVFVVTMGASIAGRISVANAVHTLGDRLIPIRSQTSELSRAYVDQETGQRAYMLTGNVIALELYEAGVAAANRLAPELHRELAGMTYADELLTVYEQELAAAAVWNEQAAVPQIAAIRTGSVERAQLDQMVLEGKLLFDKLRERFRALNAQIDTLIAQEIEHIRSVLRLANISQYVALAVLVASVIGCIATVRRMLTRPVSQLVSTVRAVADGDYDQPIGRGGPREIAEISAAVDDMRNRLRELARFDSVTGLVNRAETMARVDAALKCRRSPGALVGLLYCDIDHFKQINDTWGHAVGDAVLSTIATRMRECVHLDDTVGRIGGDELLILLTNVGSAEEVVEIGERIRALAAEPIHQFGLTIQTTLSIGAASSPDPDEDAAAVTARADAAMYRAKQAGRNTVAIDA
ncbi:diguanylate cyclase (GGDEF)-like protein [Mycolicibacterium sp. BK556]|uniref:diguanylate cyclase domain-containing protein n=2 Tax=Mycolicibacterium TaxID=1866885 RepID=UPI0017DC060D|nr:diguanylate cyclase (GGDEF)-like protein [Mycolicibacterium sp. BK556]MBB3630775.1 diguanylate cyclase (GGDEF)-like protein [Mycolicibacterium sp. BK607]